MSAPGQPLSLRHRRVATPLRAAAAVGAVSCLLLLIPIGGASPSLHVASSGAGAFATPPASGAKLTNVTYNSSVDGFPLSYLEWLPPGFKANHTYSLLVYMHGEGTSSNWVPGGSGNGLTGFQTGNTPGDQVLRSITSNATHFNFIMIALSPRTTDGFFANTPCGGPQDNDTVDAIVHEQSLRAISGVYLVGFSMGSIGAISLAGHHPGLIKGIAVTGTVTDLFEAFAHHPSRFSGALPMVCYSWPSPTNTTTDGVFDYLSVLRFQPLNFSGIDLWFAAGGRDQAATNNPAYWPFEMVNDTLLNATCLSATSYGEPLSCTTPIATLEAAQPGNFSYRFLWEPQATHLFSQLDAHDMFQYFAGQVKSGCVTSTFPPQKLSAC